MDLGEQIGRLRRWLAERLRPRSAIHIKDFWASPEEAARLAAETPGELARLFFATQGRMIHKWPHYLPIYERYFAPYHGTPARLLEIGVSGGGSLDLWRRYLGPDATVFGIDIDPACATAVSPPNQVRIGSQADPTFLRRVIDALRIVRGDASDLVLPPAHSEEFKSLARRLNYKEKDRTANAELLAADLRQQMTTVHDLFLARYDK